jgi:hypothetical protein
MPFRYAACADGTFGGLVGFETKRRIMTAKPPQSPRTIARLTAPTRPPILRTSKMHGPEVQPIIRKSAARRATRKSIRPIRVISRIVEVHHANINQDAGQQSPRRPGSLARKCQGTAGNPQATGRIRSALQEQGVRRRRRARQSSHARPTEKGWKVIAPIMQQA